MTSMFRVKEVRMPWQLSDDALEEQVKLLTQQQVDTQKVAPPPDAAFDFADKIQQDFLSQPQPQIKAAPAQRPSPLAVQEQQVQQRGTSLAGALTGALTGPQAAGELVGRLGAPLPGDDILAGQMGVLSSEESAIATAERVEAAKEAEAAARADQEARSKLRSMPAGEGVPVNPLNGLPITGVITDLTGKPYAGSETADLEQTGQNILEEQHAVAEAKKDVALAEKEPVTQKWWLNAGQIAARSAAQMGTSALKAGPIVWEGIRDFYNADQLVGGGRSTTRAWIDTVDKALETMLPGDKAQSRDFITGLASGTGSFAGFMIAGWVGAAMGLPAGFTTGALGASTGGTQLFEEAEQFGATGLQKYMAFISGMGLGALEAVPVDRMFMRADVGTGGLVRRMLNNTTATSGEEFLQELSQAIGEDVVAKYLVGFDPDREIDPVEWVKQGVIGAITGAAGGGVATLATEAGIAAGPSAPVDEQQRLVDAAISRMEEELNQLPGIGDVAENLPPEGGLDLETEAATAIDVEMPQETADRFADEAERRAAAAGELVNERFVSISEGRRLSAEAVDRGQPVVMFNDRVFRAPTHEQALRKAIAAFPEAEAAIDADPDAHIGFAVREAEAKTGERVVARGGTMPAVREDGRIELTHWATAPRATLSPAQMGTGPLRGQERQRLFGPDAVPRTYYGVDARASMTAKERRKIPFDQQRRMGYVREAGIGEIRHTVSIEPDKLYNWFEDPLGLKAGLDRELAPSEQVTQYERIIRDAGFSGYYIEEGPQGQTVALFEEAIPERIIDERTGEELSAPSEEFEAKRTAAPQPTPEELAAQIPGLKGVLRYLTPAEKKKITKRNAARLVTMFEEMPDAKEMAAVAVSGRAKRGWYANSARALVEIFGVEDAPRFAALLAALSPQNSVESNAVNALNTWVNWDKAGRPQDRATILKIMGRSVEGGGTEASVLDAWKNNSIRALTAPDPTAIVLSGPKVDSFMRNLSGVVNEVTNDAWMANFANIDQKLLQGTVTERGAGSTFIDKSPGYVAMSAAVRAAADSATKLTGETWTPAEVQETVWSWAKTLYETAGSGRTALEILNAGGLTNEAIAATPDFATLFTTGVYRNILEKGGYDVEAIASGGQADVAPRPAGPVTVPEGAQAAQEAFERHLRRAARRLDQLRVRREAEARQREQEVTGRVAPVDEDGLPQATGEVVEDVPFFEESRVESAEFAGFFDEYEATVVREDVDLSKLPGSAGPIESVVRAARAYARSIGLPVRRQKEYVKADPERGARIAAAYEAMPHAPADPEVAAAYRAMIDETLAQYQFVKASGLKVEAIEPEFVGTEDPRYEELYKNESYPRVLRVNGRIFRGDDHAQALRAAMEDGMGQRWIDTFGEFGIEVPTDPYPEGPKQVIDDLRNGHLWFFPTDQGFGTLTEISDNPLLQPTGEFIGDRELLANDVFRIVHDFFGHGMEGSGFGARGEENAWQSHMRLYTPAALPAVTSETRGQNSWVNFGPFGEQNRANQRETVYADQKTGLMPSWTWTEGVADDTAFEAAVGQPQGTAGARAPFKAEPTRPVQGVPTTPGTAEEGTDASLAKISTGFINLLNLTARQGRLTLKGSDVMGQYSKNQRTVRLRTWNDLSTLVHEGGHALHDMMAGPLRAFVNRNEAEIMQAATDLYGGDTNTMPKATHIREGFAEFFRVYTLNRAYAERHYPTLADEFKTLLERENPTLERGLQLVQQQFTAYLQAPSVQVLKNMVVTGKRDVGINAAIQELREVGFRSWMAEFTRQTVEASVNRFAGLNSLVTEMLNIGERNTKAAIDLTRAKDPRTLARLAPNFGQRALVQMTDGIMPYQSTEPASASLREAILLSQGLPADASPRQLDQQRLDDFDTYLVALRALDEYRRFKEGKIERPPVGASLGDVVVAAKELRDKYGDSFNDAAMKVHDFGMAMWKKQYDAGLMTRDTYREGLDRQFYVPLQRDMSDKQARFPGSALTGAKSLVKRFRGSDRQIVSPTAVLMHKLFSLEKAIAENDVKRALAQLADRVGTAGALVERIPATQMIGQNYSVRDIARQLTKDDTISEADAVDLLTILSGSIKEGNTMAMFRSEQVTEAGENILFFFEQGKIQAIQLKDGDLGADIVNLMNGLGRENLGFGMELVAGTSQVYRTAITSWPDFLIVNFIRDQFSAWVLNNVGFKPFATGIRGMLDEVRQRSWARKYNASMGIMGGMNVAALHKARMERDVQSLKNKGYIHKAFGDPGFMGAVAGFGRLIELSETGTRLGLFRKAYERGIADGLTDHEAAVEAAYIATDYIDFGLNGNRMLTARRVIPFLNAQIQGFYKMVRTLGADEVRQRKGLKFALKAYFKSTKNMELSRVEKLAIRTGRAAWVKMAVLGMLSAATHFLFEDDEDYQEVGEYMRTTNWVIPVGDGRIISIPKPFELAMIANAVERGIEHASGDDTAKMKFLRGMALSMTPPTSPPAIQSVVEWMANKDFFTGQEIVPSYMQALSPELQYNNYTSEIAKEIGQITGWSPMVVEHFMSGLGASAYRDMTTMVNSLDPNRPTLDSTDAPIARRFVRDVRRGSQTSADFWAQASMLNGKLRTAEVTYKEFLEQGNEPAANRFLSSLSDDEQAYALLATHFKADAKRLNPFYRGRQISTIVSGMRREIVTALGLEDTDKFSDTKTIRLTAKRKAQVDELLSEIARREMRNTLVATGAPGWAGKKPMRVEETMALLEETAPRAYEELVRRLDKAKVYDGLAVFEGWPEVRDRLLQDREDAFLNDMISGAKAFR